jgi:hypothetical protein
MTPPFDIDCRDADYRRDPERPRLKAQLADKPTAVRLVGADRTEALSGLTDSYSSNNVQTKEN